MNDDLLLDTHMLLWLVRGDQRAAWLQPFVDDDACTVSVSSIVLTEIAVKSTIGKLPDDVAVIRARCRDLGMLELAFNANHVESLAQLPLVHRDPFDRMLIAQALAEDLAIATADQAFAGYDGLRIHAA